MQVNINNEGLITEIGFFNYQYECPEFINFDNFHLMKCINITDHMNPDSWELITTNDQT